MAFSKALYFVALLPPQEVKEEVLNMKLEFREKYNAKHALKLPAHITLVPPLWLEKIEEQEFVNRLKKFAEKVNPFFIVLKNFGHFGPRVIYINVEDNAALQNLHKNLRETLNKFLPGETSANFHPHITLATRDLQKNEFAKAWEDFKNRSYLAEVEIGDLTLFRHNGKTWDEVEQFNFSEKEV